MRSTILIICLALGFNLLGADGWNWGPQESKARNEWKKMETFLAIKQYSNAIEPCNWLLENTPELNVGLYIKAAKVYSECIDEELRKKDFDKEKLMALQDKELSIYDARIKYFGDEANVLNRKGKVAYKYLGYREGELNNLHSLYSKIIELRGTSAYEINFSNYVNVLVAEYKASMLTKEEVLNKYLELHDLIDAKKEKKLNSNKPADKVDKYISSMESTFAENVQLDCNDAHKAFEKKFNESPSIKTAKSIYTIMSNGSCNDDELYMKTVEYLAKEESNPSYYIALGDLNFNKKDYNTSYSWYEKSLALITDSLKKADVYYDMAGIMKSQGSFAEARTLAHNSLAFNPSLTKNHTLIGNMYLSSYEICKSDDPVLSRAVFIAAYNEYALAGNAQGMSASKAQFPSTNDIFMTNRKEGDVVPVGCWIGGTVKAVKR